MSDLFNLIKEKQYWSGTRSEFKDLISIIENADENSRKLKSTKKPYSFLPVTDRRIQWFSTKKIIPLPMDTKYNYEHLVYYWLAIRLRKHKEFPYKWELLEDLHLKTTIKQAEEMLDPKNDKAHSKNLTEHPLNNFTSEALIKGLQKMGRKEGRALKSNLVRLAITPWCHVTINENNIAELTPEDADILTNAFRQSLSKIMQEK